jgi:PAS domain S-box-containing protein
VEPQHQADGQTIWLETNKLPLRNLQGEVIGVLGTYQDISDRKTTEFALQASETKFRRITESVPGMIFRYILHPDGRDELVHVSPQVQQIFELTPEAVLQDLSCLWARFHTEDVPKIQSAIQDSADSLQPFFVEARLLFPGDRLKWIEVSSQPDRQENGDTIWDGIVVDISDRKAAEKALMLEQTHLAALLNNIPHIAWIKDEEGRVIAVNEPFAQAFGVSAEELVGKTDYDIWPADLAQAYRDDDAEVLRSGQRKVVIDRGARADGILGWFETTKTPFRDEQQAIAGTVGIAADITERKQAEQQLQELSERLELAIQSAQIGVWEFDFSSNRLFWDDRMLAIYGISPDAFHGTYDDWSSRVHPHDLPQAQPDISHEQAFYSTEFRIIRPDGTVRWIMSFSCKQRNPQGELVRAVGVNLDISDRKQAETQINQQMAAIEAAIDGIGILRNGVYLYLNQAHVDLCGYASSTELIGKSWRILYSPTELTRFDQEIFPALERDRAWQGETICTRKDGSWLYTGLSLTLTDDDLLICVCQDINDRKNIELALQKSQAQFRRLTENVPGMIYRYVLLPDGRDCFTYVSPQILELYELEADQVIQDPTALWARIHPDDISTLRVKVQESATNLMPFVLEHRLITPSGLKFAKAISQPERQEDGSIFWDGVVIDITDLKLTELVGYSVSSRTISGCERFAFISPLKRFSHGAVEIHDEFQNTSL